MTKVITFGNFKGGVGKTTASCIFSYLLYKQGYKVLIVDFDPQANSTNFCSLTFDKDMTESTSLFEAIQAQDLRKCLTKLDENIDILPSAIDLSDFPRLLYKLSGKNQDKEHYYLDYLISDLKQDYDFVIIDVPPTISVFTNNALVASDYTVIILQTELDSLTGAIEYKDYVEKMIRFNSSLKILGVVPFLMNKQSKIDEFILKTASSKSHKIDHLIFNGQIYSSERVKRYRIGGITDEDWHDKNTLKMYRNVLDEIINSMEEIKND